MTTNTSGIFLFILRYGFVLYDKPSPVRNRVSKLRLNAPNAGAGSCKTNKEWRGAKIVRWDRPIAQFGSKKAALFSEGHICHVRIRKSRSRKPVSNRQVLHLPPYILQNYMQKLPGN